MAEVVEQQLNLGQVKINEYRCNQCKFFYRKHWEGGKSWGKCELGKSKYDAPAKKPACAAFEPKEDHP